MKISIITATYNSGRTLRYTIESVLRQTYQDIEYLIVDGCSKDDTLEIVKDYESKFGDKMRWISEPDNGIYDAMNKGLRMATGDVVGILNSDDFYTSDDIVETIAANMSDEVDAVYGDIHFVEDANLDKCVRYYTSKYFRPWQMRFGFMPAHPSFYCRRSVYEKYGRFDSTMGIAADFENLLRLIFINKIKIRYINKDFVTMRSGGASTSGWTSHKRILKEHLKAYKKNGVFSNVVFEGARYAFKLIEVNLQKIKY